MAQGADSVTQWWRRISLRAKVTGVTVAVLALGLVVAIVLVVTASLTLSAAFDGVAAISDTSSPAG